MVDIDSLMELFDEMEESEIEKLCLTMNTKAGANFSLIITPPARRVFVHPEPVKVPEKEPEKAPEAVEVKAPAPEKKALSDDEFKRALEAAVEKPKRGGRPKKEKTTDQILDDMARKRGEF